MTIAQGLKLKNKLATRLREIDTQIRANNVYEQGETPPYDVTELMKERTEVSNRLINLKTAISIANVPVVGLIFNQAELKGYVATLKAVRTDARKQRTGFGEEVTIFVAKVSTRERDDHVKELEAQIDKIQDQLDTFNHSTQIEA